MKEGNISCESYYNIRPKSEETWKKKDRKKSTIERKPEKEL
jgi:hypothetical protein